ncbi:putative G-protein coupled receptor 83, partial [Stegodyphus mimosarum]
MLALVVVCFALCWLPLNVYHILQEFLGPKFAYSTSKGTQRSTIFFLCHWLAMSSVCYNPFIYCWMNKHFRSGAVSCFLCLQTFGRKLNNSFRSTVPANT